MDASNSPSERTEFSWRRVGSVFILLAISRLIADVWNYLAPDRYGYAFIATTSYTIAICLIYALRYHHRRVVNLRDWLGMIAFGLLFGLLVNAVIRSI